MVEEEGKDGKEEEEGEEERAYLPDTPNTLVLCQQACGGRSMLPCSPPSLEKGARGASDWLNQARTPTGNEEVVGVVQGGRRKDEEEE